MFRNWIQMSSYEQNDQQNIEATDGIFFSIVTNRKTLKPFLVFCSLFIWKAFLWKQFIFPISPKILPIFPNLPVDGLDLSHRRCCDNPGSVTNCTHPTGRISMCWVLPIRFSVAALHFRWFTNSSILEREICIVIKIVFQKHYKVTTQIYNSNLP